VYKNRMSEDAFMQTLADGGHMVGEMAKFVYHPSPQDPDITVRERFFTRPDKRCKSCQFRARSGEEERSGIHECWAHAIGEGWLQGDASITGDREIPLSVDLWGGGGRVMGRVVESGHAFLHDIVESSFQPKEDKKPKKMEFTPHERRLLQIDLVRKPEVSYHIQKETLLDYLNAWDNPWHLIDFETSAPSIPFFQGMRPYQTVAFQFSHHRRNLFEARGVWKRARDA
jgi:hypothetical protein